MNKEKIREFLIVGGVENMKKFGYAHVTLQNILTDEIYSKFFKAMLKDNMGVVEDVDEVINELIKEI